MMSGAETRTGAMSRFRALSTASPRTGSAAAPVFHSLPLSTPRQWRPNLGHMRQSSERRNVLSPELISTRHASMDETLSTSLSDQMRPRSGSEDPLWPDLSPESVRTVPRLSSSKTTFRSQLGNKDMNTTSLAAARAKARNAQKINDGMVYLDGPQVYACSQCRTHLTSHDDIISKSFHGRHGRAYLFDQCVNVTIGPAEDRALITGLHSVCDIFCKRCKHMVGWTYAKAYESSQKYKEGKFIIEKINLHLEESGYYDVNAPAGERVDRWRRRSMSWGNEDIVYEYGGRSPSNAPSWERSPVSTKWSSSGSGESCWDSPVGMPEAPVL